MGNFKKTLISNTPVPDVNKSWRNHVTWFSYRFMALVSRILASKSFSSQVILLRARCSGLINRFPPVRQGKSNAVTWRFLSTTALRNAGLAATEATTKAVRPKIKSEEVKRLIGLAKPEKYRLTGNTNLLFIQYSLSYSFNIFQVELGFCSFLVP